MTHCAGLARGQTEAVSGSRSLGEQIDVLLARAARGDRSAGLARAMEDVLCEGYVACLELDARAQRLARRQAGVGAPGSIEATGESEELDELRKALEASAAQGRRDLGVLRERFVELGGVKAALR